MADPAWLSYTSAITGVVGTITGIAGAVMGYVGYRRTDKLRAIDLRLELRKSEQELRFLVLGMSGHLDHTKRSRQAVAAAKGLRGSGAMQKWQAEWDEDISAAKVMASALPDPTATYALLDHPELESKLVATHAALHSAQLLQAKYDASLAADDKDRDHIREDIRISTQAKLQGKG